MFRQISTQIIFAMKLTKCPHESLKQGLNKIGTSWLVNKWKKCILVCTCAKIITEI